MGGETEPPRAGKERSLVVLVGLARWLGRLSIVAPHDLYYLSVEDPLPSGAEAIDPTLATSSIVEGSGVRGQGSDSNLEILAPDPRPLIPGWWNWYSRSELRDEKVVLFADTLPKGSYLYSYTMRLTLPGAFHVIPTTASEMYFPEVYGRGDGQLLRVSR